jgi:Xaa-Pro aminopeptidase
MFFLGPESDVPEEVRSAFETVKDAITAASEFVKPGIAGHEADAIARDLVKERGYDEYQHALGHQLGRNAHDGGTLLGPLWDRYGDTPNGIVEEANVFTLELYVTTQDYGQLSLEEDIVVTSSGCRFLSQRQLELIHIE